MNKAMPGRIRNGSIDCTSYGLKARSARCDFHGCLPLSLDVDLTTLDLYRAEGFCFVSINIGMDFTPVDETLRILESFSNQIAARSNAYLLAHTATDIENARDTGRLAIGFDIEGIGQLAGLPDLVFSLREKGVGWMLLAYNSNNALAGGCADNDTGLTAMGQDIVRSMNGAGVVIDCSHVGKRSTLEIMEMSLAPVIFSHSNPSTVWPHFRNIDDEQIRACAATGGVVGINGVNWFLGDVSSSPSIIGEHIDYVAQMVGHRHVGIGLDFLIGSADASTVVAKWPQLASPMGPLFFAGPKITDEIAADLVLRGYSADELAAVMGDNLIRVARNVWK